MVAGPALRRVVGSEQQSWSGWVAEQQARRGQSGVGAAPCPPNSVFSWSTGNRIWQHTDMVGVVRAVKLLAAGSTAPTIPPDSSSISQTANLKSYDCTYSSDLSLCSLLTNPLSLVLTCAASCVTPLSHVSPFKICTSWTN